MAGQATSFRGILGGMLTWFDWLAALILVALAVRGYGRGLILQLAAVVAVALGLLGGLYLHSGARMGDQILPRVRGLYSDWHLL